tara:strand:- start:667 stop:1560 length:894 start_codon:yes stop_codon:yes gene_type:complete
MRPDCWEGGTSGAVELSHEPLPDRKSHPGPPGMLYGLARYGKHTGSAADANLTKSEKSTDQSSARPAGREQTSLRKWMRRLLVALAIVLLAPFVLVLAYIVIPPPVSSLMLWRMVQGQGITRYWTPLEQFSPNLVDAVLSSEDGRFCLHQGVDWQAVEIVLDDLIDGGNPRGASTLTMQTVKNLFLWPSRSYLRKALEIPLALYADLFWSKRRIAEIYLNVAEWGPGLYGAEAAARRYFGKTAARLSMREASLLATALPNPLARNPRQPSAAHARLARTVEARARKSAGLFSCVGNR